LQAKHLNRRFEPAQSLFIVPGVAILGWQFVQIATCRICVCNSSALEVSPFSGSYRGVADVKGDVGEKADGNADRWWEFLDRGVSEDICLDPMKLAWGGPCAHAMSLIWPISCSRFKLSVWWDGGCCCTAKAVGSAGSVTGKM
jgi:hypothetical protein